MSEAITVTCSEPIFGSTLALFVGTDKISLEADLNRRHPGNYFIFPEWCSAFHASPENSYKHYIWLEKYNPLDSNDIAILGHEIIHYAINTLTKVGIPLGKDNDEILTHLFHYTFNSILQDLGRINKQMIKEHKNGAKKRSKT